MMFHQKRLITALLAIGLPAASAWAQVSAPVIVPPPVAPGAQTKTPTPAVPLKAAPATASVPAASAASPASSPTSVAAPAAAPVVLPPLATGSVQPGAEPAGPAASASLLQVTIPEAPKPQPEARKPDLKPSAPVAKKPVKKVPAKATAKGEEDSAPAHREPEPADPFMGIVGTPVSASQINRFVFPEPVEGIFFQEGAPLPECPENASAMDPCKPVFLNGKRVMLLQLRAGAKGPIQMMVHLKSGRFETLNLMPAAGPGAVIRLEGAEDGASDARLAESSKPAAASPQASRSGGMAAAEQNVELLSRFARGDIPAGFEPVAVSSGPVRFELFDVLEQASWDNGAGLKVHLYQVKAHGATPVAISTSLFRHENVKALALDRETITNQEPALLFMLEFVPMENQ